MSKKDAPSLLQDPETFAKMEAKLRARRNYINHEESDDTDSDYTDTDDNEWRAVDASKSGGEKSVPGEGQYAPTHVVPTALVGQSQHNLKESEQESTGSGQGVVNVAERAQLLETKLNLTPTRNPAFDSQRTPGVPAVLGAQRKPPPPSGSPTELQKVFEEALSIAGRMQDSADIAVSALHRFKILLDSGGKIDVEREKQKLADAYYKRIKNEKPNDYDKSARSHLLGLLSNLDNAHNKRQGGGRGR